MKPILDLRAAGKDSLKTNKNYNSNFDHPRYFYLNCIHWSLLVALVAVRNYRRMFESQSAGNHDKFISTSRTYMQVTNWTGPGVRRNSRPMLVYHARRKYFPEGKYKLTQRRTSTLKRRSILLKTNQRWNLTLFQRYVLTLKRHPK